jgi:hypothetical protein
MGAGPDPSFITAFKWAHQTSRLRTSPLDDTQEAPGTSPDPRKIPQKGGITLFQESHRGLAVPKTSKQVSDPICLLLGRRRWRGRGLRWCWGWDGLLKVYIHLHKDVNRIREEDGRIDILDRQLTAHAALRK